MSQPATRPLTFSIALGLAALCIVLPLGALLLIEGLFNLADVARDLRDVSVGPAERRHTRFDPDLGWVNIPGVFLRDMYGPGISLRINSQGFRNSQDFTPAVPAGKIRAICSGDSFTLGYGVDDRSTWCQEIANQDGRFETVNMGQGGYGVDQAYLWYMRDAAPLDHDVHLFAFIRADLPRMSLSNFFGYPKPVVSLRDGDLVVKKASPPRTPLLRNLRRKLQASRKLRLVAWLSRRFEPQEKRPAPGGPRLGLEAQRQRAALATRMIENLAEANARKKSVLVVVYLPTRNEYRGRPVAAVEMIQQQAEQRGIVWLDLGEPLRTLDEQTVESMYIAEGASDPLAAGHFSVTGNKIVAGWIREEVVKLSAVRGKLAARQ